uniref:AlNc14C81G5300 protein n=1 Tax=Albugo laibachii Nc14 TaxID=890382 RepID=F0WFA8_9STRA|nr:AlNc14C81G5300 [Albugo laibachii Nc14]|eukprot:CCA19890.1 AlNc14C81G5300 [Albugo laibachii Nc14]
MGVPISISASDWSITTVDVAEGVGIGGQWCPSSAVDVGAPGRLAGLEDAVSKEVTTGKLEMSIVTIFVGWEVNEREESVAGAIVRTVGQEESFFIICTTLQNWKRLLWLSW